ncbi:alpha/beta fold hydrolase [Granulicoccus phenolivorans]|uniref:alpha/beta fold hydrolase n=1 Tax=Granulicoccus phenolivorans TaxID=266854 RepID=UPI00041C51CA|nr:alpha/beta hydrolase [Granulicoccus phenolivorans]
MDSPRTVHIGDLDIAFRTAGPEGGEGDPLVFVHGLGEDSRTWQAQLSHFAAQRRVYAVDVRGHGRSSLGAADGTLDQLADDLSGFLAEVAGPSTCVGFSMGGAIVLAAAAKPDPLIRRTVVVCSSSVVGTRAAELYRTLAQDVEDRGPEYAAEAVRANLETAVLRRPADWADQVALRVEAIGDGRGYANGARAMASLKAARLTDRLSAITGPVEVLIGELDESCPWKAAQIIVDATPDAHAQYLPGVGHFVNIEDPAVLTSTLQALLD